LAISKDDAPTTHFLLSIDMLEISMKICVKAHLPFNLLAGCNTLQER
jgi:uncharacterized membrane protein